MGQKNEFGNFCADRPFEEVCSRHLSQWGYFGRLLRMGDFSRFGCTRELQAI
jgi:hypothetical protein